jgi:hypothetical protein
VVQHDIESLALSALYLIHQTSRQFLRMLFQHMLKLLLLERDQFEKLVNLTLCFVLYEALLTLDLGEEALVVLVFVEPFA